MKNEMKEEKGEANSPESYAGESDLRRAIKLITLLITLSHSIKQFPVKWQLIRNKLEQLNSHLTAAENCNFRGNWLFSGLIMTIISTANECLDLADHCIHVSYSGKLLMQSDLDQISGKFELHITELAGMYTAGILTHGNAIVVLRPGVGASRDDIRFYIRDLFTRMKIGDAVMKNQALVSLNEILGEDKKYVRILIETDESVDILVTLLESVELGIQEEAAEVISVISGFDSYKGVLVGAGIVAPLIRVLEMGSDLGKERAARALKKLTENSDNAWSVSAHGGVTVLLKICSDSNGDSIGSAFGVLKNLAGVDEIKRFMVEEGAISTFVKIMRSKDEVSQINAIEFLQTMAYGDESVRNLFIREGGIQSLVQVLDPQSLNSSKTRETALRAIESLCLSSAISVIVLIGCGFLDCVLFFLKNGEISIQELAVKMAFRLSGTSAETKKAMGEKGFMPELVRLLEAKSFEIRELAAEALSNIVAIPKNRKRFIQEDCCNVGRILRLLDPREEKSGNKKILLSLLMSLASSNSGKRKITSSEYLKHLEQLAEDDVTDAKKIIRKLSANRFRSILNGILNS